VRTKKTTVFKALVVISLLTFLIINSSTITNSARIGFMDFTAMILNAGRSAGSAVKSLLPFASLREENKALRGRIDLLTRKIEEMKLLYVENERLKNIINFRKTVAYTTIPSQVIGRDPSNWSNSIIIDKGLNNGVRQNRAVISTKGLVGRVLELGRYSSKVLLITDPNSKVGVLIQRNRQGGILTGRPDGLCKMIYIALDSDVSPGDKVTTAGFGSVFPKDILVGEVVEVEKEPGRLYKYAIVKPASDLSKLEEVLCIK